MENKEVDYKYGNKFYNYFDDFGIESIKYKPLAKEQEQQRLKEEQEQIQQEKSDKIWTTIETIWHIIGNIFKWTCIIFFGGIYLIFKFISELAKGR